MEKPNIHIIVGALVLSTFSPLQLAAQSGPGGSPISSMPPGALPPSAYQEGLVTTPNPIDRSSDLTITGNVRGGKYFHGTVPYQSSSYFEQTLPSSSLDSFIRDSTGSEDIDSFPQGNQPYYSPSQTVTSVAPGSSIVIRPPTTYFSGKVTSTLETPTQHAETMPDTGYVMPLRSPRPMSMTLQELEQQISSEIDTRPETEGLSGQQYQIMAEKFQKSMAEQLNNKTPDLRENLTVNESPLLTPIERKPTEDILKEEPLPQKQLLEKEEKSPESINLRTEEKKEDFEQPQGYEQIKQQPNEPPLGYMPMKQQPDEQPLGLRPIKQQLDDLNARIDRALGKGTTEEKDKNAANSMPGIPDVAPGLIYETPQYKVPQNNIYMPQAGEINPAIATKAREILGPYQDAESFSESKFNKNIYAAEQYLRQGKYYRAVDAYTLALIYKPDDPIAYAGKSYALFASGEYISSALFLARLLQMYPEYAQLKVDIETMTGGGENLQERLAEAEEWLGRSDAPELHFLLAYIHYQKNETDLAQKSINAAYEKAPDTPAILTLKKTIESSI